MFMPMVEGVDKSTDRWFPAIPMSPKTRGLFEDAIVENTQAITSIPKEHIDDIREAMRQTGDLQVLTDALSQIDGRSLRQAKNSALGLTRQLYQGVAVSKALSTGATIGTWIHSAGSKDPRHQHEEANGHDFDLATGVFLTGPLKGKGAGNTDKDNDAVLPGQAYGCKCTFKLKIDFGVQ